MGDEGDVDASIAFGGRVYVVYGGSNLSSAINLNELNGNDGFIFEANGPEGSRVGSSVDGAGDFNQDGLPDLIVGARSAGTGDRARAGEAYILFGSSGTQPARITRADLNGSNGLTILGDMGPDGLNLRGDAAGAAVSGIGDVNQDGTDDVAILAPLGNNGTETDVGRHYVVYGRPSNSDPILDLRTLSAEDGFVLNGFNPSDGDGLSGAERDGVSGRLDGGGDINGDGVPDLVIGAPTDRAARG